MNRNTDTHFGEAPYKNIRRSKLKRPCSHKLSMNASFITPIYRDEVLPGDTIQMKMSSLVRMTTPLDPVMDNAWIDTYFFFVPRRLVWEHWKEFMGENTTDAWTQTTQYTIPKTTAPASTGWTKNSIAHYMGARMGTENIWIDSCYLRAYALIIREWFTNQNLCEPPVVTHGDSTTTGTNGTDPVVDLEKGGQCARAVKYADYFTRCLPEPQKGPDVYLPLGSMAPVIGTDDVHTGATADANLIGHQLEMTRGANSYDQGIAAIDTGTGLAAYNTIGLAADLTQASLGPTINELRQAYAIQKMYEIDAIHGSRYIEVIRAHFGVNSPDARQQRPEYLGGARVPINMTQVVQASESGSTPMGDTAGMSLTIDNRDMFTWSATEHGILLGLAVIRTEHTYQQGIDRILRRQDRFDFYWPALSNIGEQGVKLSELYAQGTNDDDNIFGYQERWAEYRYGINRISGELNSDYAQALDSWHYGDDYSSAPSLSADWVKETRDNVDRTLALNEQDQFIADFYFDQTWTRPMPIYSVPGLTGWH